MTTTPSSVTTSQPDVTIVSARMRAGRADVEKKPAPSSLPRHPVVSKTESNIPKPRTPQRLDSIGRVKAQLHSTRSPSPMANRDDVTRNRDDVTRNHDYVTANQASPSARPSRPQVLTRQPAGGHRRGDVSRRHDDAGRRHDDVNRRHDDVSRRRDDVSRSRDDVGRYASSSQSDVRAPDDVIADVRDISARSVYADGRSKSPAGGRLVLPPTSEMRKSVERVNTADVIGNGKSFSIFLISE